MIIWLEKLIGTGWSDPKVLVAIYATIVSTITLFWNIASSAQKRKRTVKVKFSFSFGFSQNTTTGEMSKADAFMVIDAVNFSKEHVYMTKPYLKLNRRIIFNDCSTNELKIIKINGKNEYPFLLKKGQFLKENIHICNIVGAVDSVININNIKLRFEIQDTLGKTYHSKWFTYRKLKEMLMVAQNNQ